jgi:exopolysaccharide biosynthesis polyprenyl glycosylphosphotransferase
MTSNAPKLQPIETLSNSGSWDRAREHRRPRLSLNFSERKLLLVASDLLLVNLSFLLTLAIRSESNVAVFLSWERLPWFLLLTGLWIAIGTVLNIYDLAHTACVGPSLWTVSCTANLTGLLYLFIPYLTPSLPRYRFQALLFPLFAMVSVGIWRVFYAKVIVQPRFHQRALIIGAGSAGRMMANSIAKVGADNGSPHNAVPHKAAGYRLLGFVDDNFVRGSVVDGLPVLGGTHDLMRLAHDLHLDEIIVATNEQRENNYRRLSQALLDCREIGIPVTNIEYLYERLMGRVPIEDAYRQLSAIFRMNQTATNRFYHILKRAVDILVSLVGCTLMILLTPIVWVANRISSPGPLFYRQERTGKSGKRFTLIKFRSMVVNAEKDTGPVWASKSDNRVTTLGRFLRKTRLDEVPQFWNVLRGEMSLIGPRPERPEFVSQLAQRIPFYRARHAVKPGITGWAQVKHDYASSAEDARIKLQYDLYYIKYQGPYLDLLIMLRTIQVVLTSKGR